MKSEPTDPMSEGPPYNDMPYMDLPLDLLEQIEKTPVKETKPESEKPE